RADNFNAVAVGTPGRAAARAVVDGQVAVDGGNISAGVDHHSGAGACATSGGAVTGDGDGAVRGRADVAGDIDALVVATRPTRAVAGVGPPGVGDGGGGFPAPPAAAPRSGAGPRDTEGAAVAGDGTAVYLRAVIAVAGAVAAGAAYGDVAGAGGLQ